jgi:hypothetical protein
MRADKTFLPNFYGGILYLPFFIESFGYEFLIKI